MACCSEFQNECLRVVTIKYLKSFIGTDLQNNSGNAMSVSHANGDDYCPTYQELTGGTLVQNWKQGTTPYGDRDGIVVGGSYASNQLVKQQDLSLKYTRFNSLSISRSGSGNISECGGNATLTYTYDYKRYTKSMNNSCSVSTTSATVNSVCGELTYHTTYGSVTNCTSYSIGKNGSVSANSRSDSIYADVTFRGTNHKSNTITITQNALRGSYSVFDRNITTSVTSTANTTTSFGCSGGDYSASGTRHYDVQSHWKDSCGAEYPSLTSITSHGSSSLGTKSGSFSSIDCCYGGSDSDSLYFTYDSYSSSQYFSQYCARMDSCCPTPPAPTGCGIGCDEVTDETYNVTTTYLGVVSTDGLSDVKVGEETYTCIQTLDNGSTTSTTHTCDIRIDVPAGACGTSGSENVHGTEVTWEYEECPPPACDCDTVRLTPTSLSWAAADGTSANKTVTISISESSCIDSVALGSPLPSHFTATLNGTSSITIHPNGNNSTQAPYTDTLTVTYSATDGDTTKSCSSAITLTQAASACTPASCTCYMVGNATAATVAATATTTTVTWPYSAITWSTASTCTVSSASTTGTSSTTVSFAEATCSDTTKSGSFTWTDHKACKTSGCNSNDVTVNWTVIQNQPAGCDCNCDNMTVIPTSVTWDASSTAQSSITVSSASCISIDSLSPLSHFTATIGNGVITVTPKSTNTATTAIVETLTISYKANGTTCTSKTVTLTHTPQPPCQCNNVTFRLKT